ncbi:uncharacterized protein J8A68_005920 [[Candida] subhashii]|uniref:Uncharacterized protein n=1 Tax=[Candida] subhashii TaxID=561895 RepID=A0A8J5Q4T9_9ASCO|nr:uncharacterized protein J8A68_005920 [[Candida] subhashii]KAG7660501.1 hypothetical protein J8A68_005920 [[Candida] subhashii]
MRLVSQGEYNQALNEAFNRNNGTIKTSGIMAMKIYYNFVKMHIDSSAVRPFQINPNVSNDTFSKWTSSLLQQQSQPQNNSIGTLHKDKGDLVRY